MVLWAASVAVHGSWRFGEQFFSELGKEGTPALLFNAAVIAAGVLTIPLALGLRDALGKTVGPTVASTFLIAAAAALVGVGVFPITTGVYHTAASYAFFGLLVATMVVFLYPLIRSDSFRAPGGAVTVGGLIVTGVSTPTTNQELLEGIVIFVAVVWTVVLAGRLLTLRTESQG